MDFFHKVRGGPRSPNDPFFEEGNKLVQCLKKYGIYETDNEDFLHEPVESFRCNILGCHQNFNTVFLFEQHYNCYHRYTCMECKKTLSTPHLLDLHLSENHDSFFAIQAENTPMFQCFIESCKMQFMTPELRKSHCIECHNLPHSFWLHKHIKDEKSSSKISCNKNKTSKPKGQKEDDLMDLKSENYKCTEKMEVEPRSLEKEKECTKLLGSASKSKHRIFVNFTKEIANCLPDI